MNILKQSTAYTFRLGPFVDSTDGFTEENALTIAASSVLLSKAGGAFAAKNESTALTSTGASGHYTCPLNATDTNTVGELRVYANITGALPVFKDFYVVEEAVYDALFGASALGYVANAPVSVAQIAGANVNTGTAQLGVNVVNVGGSAVSATSGLINANVTQISGDSVAADNLESYCDGTTPQPVNITHVISDPVQASSNKTTNWGGTP